MRWSKNFFFVTLFFSLSAGVSSFDKSPVTSAVIEGYENMYGFRNVPYELYLPNNEAKSADGYPLVIAMHGSTQDGMKFFDGKARTDKFVTSIIPEGLSRGYAVAIIDSFFQSGLAPHEKPKFPHAISYAQDLRDLLGKRGEINDREIFITGFSYGGHEIIRGLAYKAPYGGLKWAGAVAAEPDCNLFPPPQSVDFPLLVLKGAESHYPVYPCETMANEFMKYPNRIEVKAIPKVNHFWSLNGVKTNAVAFNGCSDDPVILGADGTFTRLSGQKMSYQDVFDTCLTMNGGKPKNYDQLDVAVNAVFDYFDSLR